MLPKKSIQESIRHLYLESYNRLMRYGCSIENNKDLVHDEIQEQGQGIGPEHLTISQKMLVPDFLSLSCEF